jgi:hypothetical protein
MGSYCPSMIDNNYVSETGEDNSKWRHIDNWIVEEQR